MSWSPKTMEMLDSWIGLDTAHEHHGNDEVIFYLFIAHVWKDYHRAWDETEAKDILKRKAEEYHPEWSSELISKMVEERTKTGTLILEFLRHLKTKNNITELLVDP